MKEVNGFIYTKSGAPTEMSRAEWRQRAKQLAPGGFTRQEFGETFVHDRAGLIVAEIYAQGVLPSGRI